MLLGVADEVDLEVEAGVEAELPAGLGDELEPLVPPSGSYLFALSANFEPRVVLLVDGYEIFDGSPSEV